MSGKKELPELKVTCTSTDCDSGLHCFLQVQRRARAHGPCRECGADLIDWDRVHAKNLSDVDHTFDAFRFERIRHHFWHLDFTPHAVNYARRAGYKALETRIRTRIRNSVGDAQPYRDGRQTPMGGKNPIHYGQHATATCCRRCLEYWHAIPQGRPLSNEEVEYASELIIRFLRLRFPDLQDNGEKVPHIRGGRVDRGPVA